MQNRFFLRRENRNRISIRKINVAIKYFNSAKVGYIETRLKPLEYECKKVLFKRTCGCTVILCDADDSDGLCQKLDIESNMVYRTIHKPECHVVNKAKLPK